MRKTGYALLFLLFPLTLQAQFVTIKGISEEVKQDTVSTDYSKTNALDYIEDEQGEETEKKKRGIRGLFRKIGRWMGIRKAETDTIPTDPRLFSYDLPADDGMFIFTEADEKAYLDSVKYELIKRRHQVLKRKSMVSMPMDILETTSPFGYRSDPFTRTPKFHNGVDFRANNYFVNAVLPGLVVYAGYRGGYGYCVELKHGDIHTLYAHLSYILVQRNQPVPAGEPIGISGTTGRSTGEHLHFSVINNGKFIDPMPVLDYLASVLNEQPLEEPEELPAYTDLKGPSSKKVNARTDSLSSNGSPEVITDSIETLHPANTSGQTLIPASEREKVRGKVNYTCHKSSDSRIRYTSDRPTVGNEDGHGIIRYTDRSSTPDHGSGSQKKNGSLPPMGAGAKSGIILPTGNDSIIRIKPLRRNEQ